MREYDFGIGRPRWDNELAGIVIAIVVVFGFMIWLIVASTAEKKEHGAAITAACAGVADADYHACRQRVLDANGWEDPTEKTQPAPVMILR